MLNNSNIHLMEDLGLCCIGGRFKLDMEIGSSYGGASFRGRDLENNEQPVFIKTLVSPRGDYELAKFLTERDALNYLMHSPFKIAPFPIYFWQHERLPIYAIVTEWIEGQTLLDWLTCRSNWAAGDDLETLHRVASAVAYATMFYQHRDIHPGNIILLPKDQIIDGKRRAFDPPCHFDPAIRLLDWGESIPVMLGGHEIDSDHLLVLYHQAPKRLSGSFFSLPPETFWQKWAPENSIGGSYESWAIGLLICKILLSRDLIQHQSIGNYCEAVRSGGLTEKINSVSAELQSLKLPGGDIVPKLFRGLLEINPRIRLKPNIAARVLWDIRYEGLELTENEADVYLADPHSFEPKYGWQHSWADDYY